MTKSLTYSVIVSEEHPEMPKTVTEAYRVISEGILEGFREPGFDAYFAIPRTEKEKQSLKNPRSSVCFDAPSWYEARCRRQKGRRKRPDKAERSHSSARFDPS